MAMAADTPGTIVDGKYALVERIGVGGMGTVWRAIVYGARDFRRTVALKRVHESFHQHPDMIDMFIEEARVGAMLRHPNIVQIFDFGIDKEDRYYMVSEWVEGIHFGDYVTSFRIAGESAPWSLVTAIAVEVLRALDAAHCARDEFGRSNPVLHRDVSPPNVLLDVIGVVKLADFGMARAMDRGRITRPDILKGKLSYLAPELVQGVDPSPQSDLYSLGIVLWEAFAGERLFDAATDGEVIELLKNPQVPLLSVRRPGLPLGLVSAIHRALEREPHRRFGTALDMLEALREVLRIVPHTTSGHALGPSIDLARNRIREHR